MSRIALKESAPLKIVALSVLMISGALASNVDAREVRCPNYSPTIRDHCVHRAPEVDTRSALGGLTLFLGALAVLRGRRAKSPAKNPQV